jgi:YVTN family beta-propeller protein
MADRDNARVNLARFAPGTRRMRHRGGLVMKAAYAALLGMVALGCAQARPAATSPVMEDGGAVLVYLAPLAQESTRLRFRLAGLSAAPEEGGAFPLRPRLKEIGGRDTSRERFLASGSLPPGRYGGLTVTVEAATLRGEEGTSDLRLPAGPVPIPVPFTVARRQAVVLSLELDYRASVEAGFRFNPVFLASEPPRPAPDLLAAVSSRGADLLILFDKISGRVVGAVPTGRRPAGIVFHAAERRAYVAASGDDAVESIDLLEFRPLSRVELRGGDEPLDLALTPDGRTLLVANIGSSTVSFIDTRTMIETDRVTLQGGTSPMIDREGAELGERPSQILVDRSGQRAYVLNAASGSVSVLDVSSRRIAGTITTEPGPFRGDFNRAEDRLFVIHGPTPYVSIVDPLAMRVVSKVYVATGLTAVKVNPETDRVYLANRQSRSLDIYDPVSLLPVDMVPIDGEVSFLAIDDEGNSMYAVLPGRDEVQVLRIVGSRTTARVEVGDDPYDIALAGER